MNLLKFLKRGLESEGKNEIFYRLMSKNRLSVPTNWGDHQTSWDNLKKSMDDDNPDFALISAWAILEDEVKRKYPSKIRKIGDRRNKSICDLTSKKLQYDKKQKKELLSAMEKRNKVAHGKETHVSWKDVNCVLVAAFGIYKSN